MSAPGPYHAPAWLPDPGDPMGSIRYWDGHAWTMNVAPAPRTDGGVDEKVWWVAALILGGIGAVLNMQSVSVASGTSIVWIGAALAAAGFALAMFLTNNTAVTLVVGLLTACLVTNAVYVEHQVDDRRHQIEQQLGG